MERIRQIEKTIFILHLCQSDTCQKLPLAVLLTTLTYASLILTKNVYHRSSELVLVQPQKTHVVPRSSRHYWLDLLSECDLRDPALRLSTLRYDVSNWMFAPVGVIKTGAGIQLPASYISACRGIEEGPSETMQGEISL